MESPHLLLALVPVLAALSGAAGAEAPTVFWASDPVRPGEAVLMAGSGLATTASVELARLSNRGPGSRVETEAAFPSRFETLKAVQPSDASVKFALPDGLRVGVYACRVVTVGGKSNCILINRPDAMWLQGDGGSMASPGGWLRAFGKCLALPDGASRFLLKGPKTLALAAEADCYAAKAALPKSLPPGDYEVRVHNGYGGAAAWSQPHRIAVAERKSWPDKVFSVTDFGAGGRGTTDDTVAVRSAVEAAGREGGVVYFPRGRYRLTDALVVPRFVVLRGERRDLSMLFWPDTESPPKALIQGTNSFGIQDLAIHCSNHVHVIVGDLGSKPDAGDVFLRRVLVRADMYRGHLSQEQVAERFKKALASSSGGGDTVQLGGRNIEITDCDLYGSGRVLFLSRTRGGLVANNRLYNGRWGWYCISGSDGLVFEGNQLTGSDLMSTGGGLNCLDGSTCSQNIYFAHNTLRLFHGWDREAMTSDAGGGAYFGGVASASGPTLTLAEEPKWGARDWAGAAVFVLGGKGAGQYRRIVRTDGAKVEVEAPWAVPPDASSRVSATMLQRNYLLVGNSFEDATCAIQFYGISIHHIVAGNTSARAGGFHNIGMWYHGYQPSWFCQLLDNKVLEGNGYVGPLNQFPPLGSHVASMGFSHAPCKDPLNRYSVLRRNVLASNARVELTGVLADALVEGNRVESSDAGISVEGGVSGAWVRGNTFANVREPYAGEGIGRAGVHPAELFLARMEVLAASLGSDLSDEDRSEMEEELNRLARRPATDPAVAEGIPKLYAAAVIAALWGTAHEGVKVVPQHRSYPFWQLGRAIGDWVAADIKATAPKLMDPHTYFAVYPRFQALLGLSVEVSARSSVHSVLQSGEGGSAEAVLELSLGAGVPEVRLRPRVVGAWALQGPESSGALLDALGLAEKKEGGAIPGEPGPTLTVRGGERGSVAVPVTVPKGIWGGQELVVALHGTMAGGLPFGGWLDCLVPAHAGTGFLRDWSVIGPFPNEDKAPLDNAIHPPEEQLTLKAEYDGLGGKVKWQPARLGSNRLDLATIFQKAEDADAFAVACLQARQATKAMLSVEFAEGVRLWLNGQELFASAAPQGQKTGKRDLAIDLAQGENVLLAMVSHLKGPWLLEAEVRESGAGGNLMPVSADKLASLPVLGAEPKPPPRPAAAGALDHAEGVEWQLVFQDDFERPDLGPAWKPIQGAWRLENGALAVDGTGLIGYAKRLRSPVRIEYDARSDSPGDLTALWLRHGEGWQGGYFIGFGSNGNTANKLLKNGEQVAASERPLIAPRKWQHVVAQVLPRGVMLIVDGTVAINYRDRDVLKDPDTAGLCAWSGGRFDNVRIYTAKP